MDNDLIVEDAVPEAEKKKIERVLREGMEALADALRDVNEDTARLRPRPGAWSVLDCVEHIALTEAALLARLREAKPADRSHADAAREARFRELALNRARRIEAPDPVAPGREAQTFAAACEGVQAIRGETLKFVREFEGELRSWLTRHPLITRPVNCYEMLLLMALHPSRHAQQIAEIREQVSPARSQMK